MRLTINGADGVDRADLNIEAQCITLIAGRNADGKSSTLRAAQAVLGASPKLIQLKDGHKTGEVRFESTRGIRVITLPKNELKTVAGTGIIANEWALGVNRFGAFKDKERAQFVGAWTDVKVTKARLAAELKDLKVDLERLVLLAAGNGFDVAEKHAADVAKEKKGQFKQVTGGQVWGSKEGLAWEPEGWSYEIGEIALEDLQEQAAELHKAVEEGIGKEALINAAKAHAGKKEEYATAIAEWTETIDKLEKELAELREQIKLKSVETHPARCGNCGITGMVVDGVLKKDAPLRDDAWVQKLKVKEKEIVDRIANAQLGLGTAQSGFKHADEAAAVAAGTSDLEVNRKRWEKVEAAVKAKQKKLDATKLHYEIVDWLKAKDILAPDGLPRKILDEALGKFNKGLQKVSTLMAGWKRVHLDRDLVLNYGDRVYQKCSESEQMRADVTLQVMLALQQQQEFVIVDRVDLLDTQGRNDLFQLLMESGITVLAASTCLTVKDKLQVPDLNDMGIGTTYVMKDGVAYSMAEVKATA